MASAFKAPSAHAPVPVAVAAVDHQLLGVRVCSLSSASQRGCIYTLSSYFVCYYLSRAYSYAGGGADIAEPELARARARRSSEHGQVHGPRARHYVRTLQIARTSFFFLRCVGVTGGSAPRKVCLLSHRPLQRCAADARINGPARDNAIPKHVLDFGSQTTVPDSTPTVCKCTTTPH